MKYVIIKEFSLPELQGVINHFMKDGWRLVGELTVVNTCKSTNNNMYIREMILTSDYCEEIEKA